MFNFGFSELLVIGALALIFIGPKELPEVAKVVGRLLNELKRATTDITSSIGKVREDADEFVRSTYQDVADKIDADIELSLDSSKTPEKSSEASPKANSETSSAETSDDQKKDEV